MGEKKEEKPKQVRKVQPEEERAKRGRWVTIVVFFVTLVLGYIFWEK